ncbi:hypothetical protein COCOBI_04-7730 [Coccomyxa sp. Obi]|nr:hypothetical protein COCOBI_04-7730 [Coccomyxa sp. Obi]
MSSSEETRSRRRVGSNAQPPSLPTDLWARVAGFMSTNSWAKASGTCRAMKAVRPQHISLTVTQSAGLRWLAAHWVSSNGTFVATLVANFHPSFYYYYYYTFSSPYGLGTSSSTFMAALHSSRFLHFLRQLYGNPMASKSSLT